MDTTEGCKLSLTDNQIREVGVSGLEQSVRCIFICPDHSHAVRIWSHKLRLLYLRLSNFRYQLGPNSC